MCIYLAICANEVKQQNRKMIHTNTRESESERARRDNNVSNIFIRRYENIEKTRSLVFCLCAPPICTKYNIHINIAIKEFERNERRGDEKN